MKETFGFSQSDGRCPDGLQSLIQWQRDKPLFRDFTIATTPAASYISKRRRYSGVDGCQQLPKYADIPLSNIFQMISLEMLVTMIRSLVEYLNELDCSFSIVTGEQREDVYIPVTFQNIIVLQCHHASQQFCHGRWPGPLCHSIHFAMNCC